MAKPTKSESGTQLPAISEFQPGTYVFRRDSAIKKEAYNTPIGFAFDHCNKAVLVVNQQTGDTYFEEFDSTLESAIGFPHEPLRKLKADLFLAEPGKKVAFIFESNHDYAAMPPANIDLFLKMLEEHGVSMGGTLSSDIFKAGDIAQRFDEAHHTPDKGLGGSIRAYFRWDLQHPQEIEAGYSHPLFGIHKAPNITQHILKPIYAGTSSLPDTNEMEDKYWALTSLARVVLYNRTGYLKQCARELGIKPAEIFEAEGRLGDAVKERVSQIIKEVRPFDNPQEKMGEVITMLHYLQDAKVRKEYIAILANNYANGLAAHVEKQLGYLNTEETSHALRANADKLIKFGIALCKPDKKAADSTGPEACAHIISPGFSRLLSSLSSDTTKKQTDFLTYLQQQL